MQTKYSFNQGPHYLPFFSKITFHIFRVNMVDSVLPALQHYFTHIKKIVLIMIGSVQRSTIPVSIRRKSISGRHRPVRVADGPMTARCRFT